MSFMINEVIPRANKAGVHIEEFIPASIASVILKAEDSNLLYRKQTRTFLDYRLKQLQNKSPELTKEVLATLEVIIDLAE